MRGISCMAWGATLAWGLAASAHPVDADGHHDEAAHHVGHASDASKVRAWTNTKTHEVVRGAFLAARSIDGVVQVSVERDNGDVVVFPLNDLAPDDRAEAQRRIEEVKAMNERLASEAGGGPARPGSGAEGPAQAAPFNAFAPFVRTRWDERWLYVESDGLPHVPGSAKGTYVYSHPMMVGITAWQQQVPLPQRYTGDNAWRIPLKPELADKPVSAKEDLFRGAIALAANGVPIFNPIKNDGKTDTFLAGELDEFGGHCGRADDYHYHIAPTHLQQYVGEAAPVAYALDGFPIYGVFDPAAKAGEAKACPLGGTEKLDELNGHFGAATKVPGADGASTVAVPGLYHYHASPKYPYLNGGMRGKVTVKEGQIDPQPRATPVREWLQPLRGAKIVGFKATGKPAEPSWTLQYTVGGKPGSVSYRIEGDPSSNSARDVTYVFRFVNTDGTANEQTYSAMEQGGGRGDEGGPRGGGDRRRPRGDGERPPRDARPAREDGDRPPRDQEDGAARGAQPDSEAANADVATASGAGFALSSADVTNGRLSIDCTCDAAQPSRAPALAWGEPPAGTKSFAVVMHHVPPEGGARVYMVVANIAASARGLRSGDTSVGVWGQNSVTKKGEYAPPCSKGPGDKVYTITVYALSADVKLPAESKTPITRDYLLGEIKQTTLGTATLDVAYARADR